jgi:methylmalonyl-CoA mutase
LSGLLQQGDRLLEEYTAAGLSPQAVNAQLRFCLSIGNSYFPEIARLRALRLLWANVLQGWGLPGPVAIPPVEVHVAPGALVEDTYLNMIRLTTQAMSAVIGGCDLLFLPPADLHAAEKRPSLTRRIARNVQHLLKMESHFDAVADPAGGSYYIEKLTEEIAERAWKDFQAA